MHARQSTANRRACAGIVLLAIIPDNSACPSVPMSGLYMYPVLCIFLGITWIARGQRLKKAQESLLPTVHAAAPDGQQPVQAVAMTAQPAK